MDYLLPMAVSIILATVKNPAKKAEVRNVMLKIFNTIKSAYPGDNDFT